VTQAIGRAYSLSDADAERAKHESGFLATARQPATSAEWARVSDVIKQELAPLVRELKQTLAACRAQTGVAPAHAVLCGGGARLRGLDSYLGEELGLDVVGISAEDSARIVGVQAATRGAQADACALAVGVALEGATGRAPYDLRKGPFIYRADFGFLRQKAGYLAAITLVLVAFAAGNAYAALYQLRKERGILADRLKTTSTEILGAPATVAEVEEKITPKKEEDPLPKSSAFDQVVEISRKLPPRQDVKLDVAELDVRKDKVMFKATTDSRKAIDDIEASLKGIECFSDIQRGKIVEDTATKEVDFQLTITSKCM
jgi:general secretion pathway protein L